MSNLDDYYIFLMLSITHHKIISFCQKCQTCNEVLCWRITLLSQNCHFALELCTKAWFSLWSIYQWHLLLNHFGEFGITVVFLHSIGGWSIVCDNRLHCIDECILPFLSHLDFLLLHLGWAQLPHLLTGLWIIHLFVGRCRRLEITCILFPFVLTCITSGNVLRFFSSILSHVTLIVGKLEWKQRLFYQSGKLSQNDKENLLCWP